MCNLAMIGFHSSIQAGTTLSFLDRDQLLQDQFGQDDDYLDPEGGTAFKEGTCMPLNADYAMARPDKWWSDSFLPQGNSVAIEDTAGLPDTKDPQLLWSDPDQSNAVFEAAATAVSKNCRAMAVSRGHRRHSAAGFVALQRVCRSRKAARMVPSRKQRTPGQHGH
ncbi:hypothetical protein TI39_contig5841g00005 [Zymoseptoria brevis]|uniref:Uncharacterized protein n=1 Tax=Zymoseptoria brevis TaxID=1047168 RepID=A0A0F4G695_9PEZI|nr:hypothetical protein TI39_contig5841g00005 [Zymoseptoria brevis]